MSKKTLLPRLALGLAVLGASAAAAAAQGFGYGLGEWNLVTQGGASVCHVVLTNRPIPSQASWRAFVRGGPRCSDWRARNLVMWSVRGNRMSLGDGNGRAIADLDEQNPNLYAAGEWQLARRGMGAAPGPAVPAPGRVVGDWAFITQDSGSICRLTLTNRFDGRVGAFRVIAHGGGRCTDDKGQRAAFWRMERNTLYLTDLGGQEVGKFDAQSPNLFVGGGHMLRR